MSTLPPRDGSVYVSWKTRKALGYVLNREKATCVDELAERIIKDWLEKNAANVIEHLEQMDHQDKQFKATIGQIEQPE